MLRPAIAAASGGAELALPPDRPAADASQDMALRPTFTEALRLRLKLTPKQTPAWDNYVKAWRPEPPVAATPREAFRAMTMPERMKALQDGVASDLALVRSRADAVNQLYEVLDPDQRRILDEASAPDPPGRLGLRAAESADPPPDKPNYALPSQTKANWAIYPKAEDIERVYPSQATEKNTPGKAVITCAVDTDGFLKDCVVDSETPEGQGFGNAALEITAYMRMHPATRYGMLVPGDVTIPINFKVDAGD